MLLALREAVLASEGGTLRLTTLAEELDADPAVVRSVLHHALERGWLPTVRVVDDPAACGDTTCRPVVSSAACRRCPMAGPATS
ncbi:MAG: hypothetical protein R6U94_07920 [Nitriliruptoraceae bacterium]